MFSLLITPITLLIISFLIKDEDIREVSRYLFMILSIDVISWIIYPSEAYYLRSAFIDVLMFVVIFKLDNIYKSLLVAIPCFISFLLNIYEQFSYYQTIFYPYRPYIQFILMQIMLWGIIVGCKWRTICKKTN